MDDEEVHNFQESDEFHPRRATFVFLFGFMLISLKSRAKVTHNQMCFFAQKLS